MVLFIDNKKAQATRDEVYAYLKDNDIQTKRYFYPAVHMQTAYRKYRKKYQGKLPIAEKAANEGLALPLYSHLDNKTVIKICNLLKDIL